MNLSGFRANALVSDNLRKNVHRAHSLLAILLAFTILRSATAGMTRYTFDVSWTEGQGTVELVLDPDALFSPPVYSGSPTAPGGHSFPLVADGSSYPVAGPPVPWGANTCTLIIFGDLPDGWWWFAARDTAGELVQGVSDYLTPNTGPWIGQQIINSLPNGGAFRLVSAVPVSDNQPPSCNAGNDQVIESQGTLTTVQLDGSLSTDPDGDPLEFEWSVAANSGSTIANPSSATTTGSFPLGPTLVTLTVSDGNGGVSVCDVLVTVQDTSPPVVVCTTDKISLWPPNHSMQPVMIVLQASDSYNNAQQLSVQCTVSSNELDNSGGDGSTTGDVHGQDGYTAPVSATLTFNPSSNRFEGTVNLRAERAGNNSSRIYSVNCVVTDGSGTNNTASCVVLVPHDRRRN